MWRTGAVVVALALAAGAAGAAGGCSGDGDGGDAGDDGRPSTSATGGATTTTPPPPGAADLCADAAQAPDPPTVASTALTEVSGLAASRRHPDLLWAHNDSGGEPEVVAMGRDGSDRGRFPLGGAEAFDWEDMAIGPAPAGGAGDVLYLGDIGDNIDQRDDGVVVYRVPEPEPGAAGSVAAPLGGVEALTLTYADGPRNAEALLADPVTGDLYILDKMMGGDPQSSWRVPAGTPPGVPTTIERAGPVNVPPGEIVTGGDVSADGSVVAVRTYEAVYLWARDPGQTVADVLAGEPCEAPTTFEPQGEAVAIDPDGRGYTTVSEGEHPPIHTARVG